MSNPIDNYALRNTMVQLLRQDMLGPGSERFCGFPPEKEVITAYSPQNRYSVGLLFPPRGNAKAEDDDQPENADDLYDGGSLGEDDDAGDAGVNDDPGDGEDAANANSNPEYDDEIPDRSVVDADDIGVLSQNTKPSAMGISFVIPRDKIGCVKVKATAGLYIKREKIKDEFPNGAWKSEWTEEDTLRQVCRVQIPYFHRAFFEEYFGFDVSTWLATICIHYEDSVGGSFLTFTKPPEELADAAGKKGFNKWIHHEEVWAKLDELSKRFSASFRNQVETNEVVQRRIRGSQSKDPGHDLLTYCLRTIHVEPFPHHHSTPFAPLPVLDDPNVLKDAEKDVAAFHCLGHLYSAIERLYSQWEHGTKRFELKWEGTLDRLDDIGSCKLESGLLGLKDLELCLERHSYGDNGTDSQFFLSLVNSSANDPAVFAQPCITVTTTEPGVFRPLRRIKLKALDLEDKIMQMQYRNKMMYARGCGCSAVWEDDGESVTEIRSEFMPRKAIPQIDQNIQSDDPDHKNLCVKALKIGYLADRLTADDFQAINPNDRMEKCLALAAFVTNYKDWICSEEKRKNSDPSLDGEYQDAADEVLNRCRKACERMNSGVELLRTDDRTYRAFCLANRAIFDSMKHKGSGTAHPWRPFQLGFFLLTLESIVNPGSEFRDVADLLWFPTGGGKTEAYLALTAFSIFHRYLTQEDPSGTTVIMRYTLRLLASQQFERACTLICACDQIREDENDLKTKPEITIGLWVGSKVTPNKVRGEHGAFTKLDHAINNQDPIPFQPLVCPWCHEPLNYEKDEDRHRLVARCINPKCVYGKGCDAPDLPLQIVDETLYEDPPTLLFGTVDKFAQLTFQPKAGSLFGLEKGQRVRQPPALIIQDELHLITESLGSLVGAFEAVVDGLCRYDCGGIPGRSPKIIASTATARRAPQQCKALYAREKTHQFPPPGLSVEDSYFCREKKEVGREYLGIQSLPLTPADTLIRLMASASLRASHLGLQGFDAQKADQYYTLVAYFNSLRELGSCESWVQSKIRERMMGLSDYDHLGRRNLGDPTLLCSRRSQPEISEILNRMGQGLGTQAGKRPIDTLLASNMLSVGLDVDRLGLMIVAGQPKKNAEFIQASSRVGRLEQESGLVVSFFNGKRVRDRSYFEVFPDFIQSFYKYVEPATVTPCTFAVRERLLTQVVVTLVRHLVPGLQERPHTGGEQLQRLLDFTVSMIKSRAPEEDKEVVEGDMRKIAEKMNQYFTRFTYDDYCPDYIPGLGRQEMDGETYVLVEPTIPALLAKADERMSAPMIMSLRNVDTAVPVMTLNFPG